jgi:hypothetical protein
MARNILPSVLLGGAIALTIDLLLTRWFAAGERFGAFGGKQPFFVWLWR